MKNRLIYLLMFFAFCVLATDHSNSKKDIPVDSLCQTSAFQHPTKGILSNDNLSEFKQLQIIRKIVALPGSQTLSTSSFYRLSVRNHPRYLAKIIVKKPPYRSIFHLHLCGLADNDDDPHSVA